ncbi:MAG: SOS response-associated peptidase [Geminicoccaceae bacterium]
MRAVRALDHALAISRDLRSRSGNALVESWNITPDRMVTTVRSDGVAVMRWGMVPPWSHDPGDRSRQINARSETAFEKPMFRDAMRARRCILPATGFYEWRRDGEHRQPWWITCKDDGVLAMAGLWQRTETPQGPLDSCLVLTMQAAPSIAAIHHRMPVMPPLTNVDAWLDLQERTGAR